LLKIRVSADCSLFIAVIRQLPLELGMLEEWNIGKMGLKRKT